MQPVEMDHEHAMPGLGSDLGWGRIVDSNVGLVWRLALASGLAEDDAAQVCQLAWLRLGQRLWRMSSDAEIASWLSTTVRREAGALATHRARRPQQLGLGDNVIPLQTTPAPALPSHAQ